MREGLGGWRDRVFGDLREVLDEGVPWVVLGGTGVAVGVVAAAIDVSVEWLADLRNGVCGAGNGGSWWLNRGFCCWGYEGESFFSFFSSGVLECRGVRVSNLTFTAG